MAQLSDIVGHFDTIRAISGRVVAVDMSDEERAVIQELVTAGLAIAESVVTDLNRAANALENIYYALEALQGSR